MAPPLHQFHRARGTALMGLALAVCSSVSAEPTAPVRHAVYDPATRLLTLQTVAVGAATYTQVTLLDDGTYTFTLQGGQQQTPPGPGTAVFDPAANLLTIPVVQVGTTTFIDVTLQHLGNYVFSLRTGSELPAATLSAVKELLASVDSKWATEVPRNGVSRMSLSDRCWRDEGRSRDFVIAEVDADPGLTYRRDAYRVGSTSSNVQVQAVRNRTNPDGSTRQEIDVQYDLRYRDGSQALGVQSTMISGSSAGTPGCSTPQNAPTLRFLGDQRLVAVRARARNVRDERHAVATGAALTPAVNYRRLLQWSVSDPMGQATYVVLSGVGPATTVGSTTVPFSLKFISPRLLRSAPELAGKTGNFLNWLDDDSWRYCRAAGSGTPVASQADCVGLGASSYESGITTATPDDAADRSFIAQGWAAGAVYRFDVYNDDGWKTINGQAGKTPIATYYSTLDKLPYTFVEMAGSGVAADKFPRLTFGAMTSAQVRGNAVSATPAAMAASWNVPPALSDARRFGLSVSYEYHQGAKVGNANSAFYPGYRWAFNSYPASTATTQPDWAVNAKPTDQVSKSYFEFTLLYSDRTDQQILSLVSFQ